MRTPRGVLPPLSSPGNPAPNPKGCACCPGFLLNRVPHADFGIHGSAFGTPMSGASALHVFCMPLATIWPAHTSGGPSAHCHASCA